jgi:hypothetical protein
MFRFNTFSRKVTPGSGHLTPAERDQRGREIREWTRSHQQTFACDPCELLLSSRAIDAATWTQWKHANSASYRPYTDYPFLVRLAGVVDQALASASDCIIDFGQLSCPYRFRILAKSELPHRTHFGDKDLSDKLSLGVRQLRRGRGPVSQGCGF